MQRRLNSETGVNKPFENGSCQGRIQKFFEGGGHQFSSLFSSAFFRAELFLSNLSAKTTLGGPGACSPGNFLKICILQ